VIPVDAFQEGLQPTGQNVMGRPLQAASPEPPGEVDLRRFTAGGQECWLAGLLKERPLHPAGAVCYNHLVPKVGIEPTLPREHEFESCASASSATSAHR
jgi:hypothetical protein